MKRSIALILAGLLVGAAPSISFADCRPSCSGGQVCRITSQGPPTVYTCMDPVTKKGIRSPGTMQRSGASASAINSPRDPASGQATGKRAQKPAKSKQAAPKKA